MIILIVQPYKKLRFQECNREEGFRIVRGNLYDGLTFKLNIDDYNRMCLNML